MSDQESSQLNFPQSSLPSSSEPQPSQPVSSTVLIGSFECDLCKKICKTTHGLKAHRGSQVCKTEQRKRKNICPTPTNVGTAASFLDALLDHRQSTPVLKRIPKGARIQAAIVLSQIVENCIQHNNESSCGKLLLFAYKSFCAPEKFERKKSTLAAIVKRNLLSEELPTRCVDEKKQP